MLAEQLRRELTRHGLDEDAPVDVLDDDGAKSIVQMARRHAAPVIVVGAGRQDGSGLAHGELAMQIVSAADRPVLVVPSDAATPTADVAVVAVDFSPASVRAAREVMPLLAFGGRLILVHVRTAVSVNQDTAATYTERFLHAFGITYYLVEGSADAARISIAFEEARRTRRPVAVLVADEYHGFNR